MEEAGKEGKTYMLTTGSIFDARQYQQSPSYYDEQAGLLQGDHFQDWQSPLALRHLEHSGINHHPFDLPSDRYGVSSNQETTLKTGTRGSHGTPFLL